MDAVVVGASGGLGAALTARLNDSGAWDQVHALSRSATGDAHIDLTDEATIAAAASRVAPGTLGLVIVASGVLHAAGLTPEKSLRALEPEALIRNFAVNAVGPALVAKHFTPLFPRQGRAVFAALSARVGSIGDNRLGGWHSYRASKAALNMLLKTIAIELARTRPDALCIGLHPGTVDTSLSQPFQTGVAPDRLFTPDGSASHLLRVIESLGPGDSGGVFAWDGARIAE